MTDSEKLVYSTDQGRMCPECGKPKKSCVCKNAMPAPSGDGTIRVQRESKGRNGKIVTVLSGFLLPPDELKALAKSLKARCGTGGTSKEYTIEIQGDHKDLLLKELEGRGFKVKAAGGY